MTSFGIVLLFVAAALGVASPLFGEEVPELSETSSLRSSLNKQLVGMIT